MKTVEKIFKRLGYVKEIPDVLAEMPILITSTYSKHPEKALGFEYEMLLSAGVSESDIQMNVLPNSRIKIPSIERNIKNYWESNKKPGQFDGDLLRFEGARLYRDGKLVIDVSDMKYSEHNFLNKSGLPKELQGNPWSMGGIVLTGDNKIVTGLRNPKVVDQGRIEHIVPAGFAEYKESTLRGKSPENPIQNALRELNEELLGVKPRKMEVLAITYNSYKNFDTTASVLIPTDVHSSEIELAEDEHEEIIFTDATQKSLEDKFRELCENPDNNSGHLRGHIGALYARKYEVPAYNTMIEKTINDIIEENGR